MTVSACSSCSATHTVVRPNPQTHADDFMQVKDSGQVVSITPSAPATVSHGAALSSGTLSAILAFSSL